MKAIQITSKMAGFCRMELITMKHIIVFIVFFCSPIIMVAQWVPVSVPTTQGLEAITFTDALHGFITVGDGSILESSDGGMNWQTVLTGSGTAPLYDICFPTASTGYCAGDDGYIVKTINAGSSWPVINSPTYNMLRGVSFLNRDTGFVCGQSECIYRTTDGGTTWVLLNSGAYWLRKFSFPTLQTGYCAGDNHLVFQTTDGGLTWNQMYEGGPNLSGIQFLTVDTGYVCGATGYAAKSVDGGQTWQVLNTGTTINFNGLWFFNTQSGYYVGDSGLILKTTNGGTTWTQEASGTSFRLNHLYYFHQCQGFISGDAGTLLKKGMSSPDSIRGPSSVCLGDSGEIYSVDTVAGATGYHWSVPSGVIITSGDNTNIITVKYPSNSVSGTFSVYAYDAGCNSASSPVFSVTVNPIPETPIVTYEGHLLFSTVPTGNQWYLNGAPIAGATGQVYDPTLSGPGYYWTVVTINGCSSDTSNHKIITNGIDSQSSSAISVYPVPNDGEFFISITTGSSESFSISVYDCLGEKIHYETNVEADRSVQKVIDLRPLPNGVYNIVINNSQECVVRKIVVGN
jgi:photosystem II stability/assembly factor-like uncharacterized protein